MLHRQIQVWRAIILRHFKNGTFYLEFGFTRAQTNHLSFLLPSPYPPAILGDLFEQDSEYVNECGIDPVIVVADSEGWANTIYLMAFRRDGL